MNRNYLKFAIFCTLPIASCPVWAGAVTDGSLGPRQILNGKFVIPQNLGTTRGANLFHSFERFSVEQGEQAQFIANATTQNIIARVTGGGSSLINGYLQVKGEAGSRPNFYFINPAGIIIGADAQLDVPASLYLSSASYLRFKDGDLHADLTKNSQLSVATPEAFGFLARQQASIEFSAGANVNAGQAQEVHLSAARITMNEAKLSAPGAQISMQTTRLDEVIRPGQLSENTSGEISLRAGSQVSSSSTQGQAAGNIVLQSAQISLDGSITNADGLTSPAETAVRANAHAYAARSGDILVKAQRVSLQNDARFSSSSFNAADAGDIRMQAESLEVNGGGSIAGVFSQANQSGEQSSGRGGNIALELSRELSLKNGAQISASTFSDQAAGGIQIRSGTISIDGSEARGPDTGILSLSYGGKGAGGNIEIVNQGLLQIRASGQISSATMGSGNAADLKVTTAKLEIDGEAISTGINSISSGAGQAGNLHVVVSDDALLKNFGGVSSSSFGTGKAGEIHFSARNLTIDGKGLGGGIYSDSGDFRTAATFAGGDAGSINLAIQDSLKLSDSGRISSTTYTRGKSGQILVQAGQLVLQGAGSGVFAETIGQGDAGAIQVFASQRIDLLQGAQISSSTRFAGKGGRVLIQTNDLNLSGPGSAILSEASSGAQQDAGAIKIQAQNLKLSNGGQISSETNSYQQASAGSVSVHAGLLSIDGQPADNNTTEKVQTGIFSSANQHDVDLYSRGNGGAINIVAKQIELKNGAAIASDTYARGRAGQVQIQADAMNLQNRAEIRSQAEPDSAAQVGSVKLQIAGLLNMDQSQISIKNRATQAADVSKSQLSVVAGQLQTQQSEISASALATQAASDIQIAYALSWHSKASQISTSAVDGNGGHIQISGYGPLQLNRTQITTSVAGQTQGNGGNIYLQAPVLVLANTTILANTYAPAANGGNIQIQAPTLLAEAQQLHLGGSAITPQSLPNYGNVIQAAAPDGVSGQLNLSSVPVDISASLLKLELHLPDLAEIVADLCRNGSGNSFSLLGRGQVAYTGLGWLSPYRKTKSD